MLRYLQVLVWVYGRDWVSIIALQLLEKGIISLVELCVASRVPFFKDLSSISDHLSSRNLNQDLEIA